MTDKPTVEQALRYVENGKICEPYALLDVLAEEVQRLRAPRNAAMIVKRYIETTRPTGLASWHSTLKDMDYVAAEPAAALAQDASFNPSR